ncbi:ribosome biogenesis GTPase Der [Candidatus Latescibacterota bacterium]
METSVVAIIGRPNVGKSTLFNRIIRRSYAIVDDQSGVTRDRNAMEFDWNGKTFMLMDTGGFVVDSSDTMEQAVTEQSLIAVEEADVVLFLTDVKSGITDYDVAVANVLQKSGKSVILAVNKVDNNRVEPDIYEFYNLGVGDPFPISGKTGRGSGDLLDAIVEKLPREENDEGDEKDHPLRIALIGRPNVGKSSIVNCLTGKNSVLVTDIPGTTRDSTDTHLTHNGREVVLIDTAGLKRKTKLKESLEYYSSLRTFRSLSRCDVAVVVIDINAGLTTYEKTLVDDVEKMGKGLLIVANKWDLIEKDHTTMKAYETEIRDELPNKESFRVIFTSANTSQRVVKLIDTAIEIEEAWKYRIPTSDLNDFIDRLRFPPTAGDVSLIYGTQHGVEPPSFVFFVSDTRKIKDNVAKYIERRIRSEFGFEGSPVRLSFKPRTKKDR